MLKEELHHLVQTKTGRIFEPTLKKILQKTGLLDDVLSVGPVKAGLVERYYWWFYGLTSYPRSCRVCQSPLTRFSGFHAGYLHETCSRRCAALDERRVKKTKSTLVKKYGVEHHMHAPEVKQKVKNTIQTRYGVTCILASEVALKGLQKKFGDVENISQTEMWKRKTRTTFLEKFGGPGFSGALSERSRDTLLRELGLDSTDKRTFHQLAALVASKRKITQQAVQHGFILNEFNAREKNIRLTHVECGHERQLSLNEPARWRCLRCFPRSVSSFETEVADFIRSIYDGQVLLHDRKLIKPLEIDILIPEKRLAIECNGDYWHSYDRQETKEEREKHLRKLEAVEAAGMGLIQLAEHEWQEKRDIVKSILTVRLGKAQKIPARKAKIESISLPIAHRFCEEHHIQGKAPASAALGLFYEQELVAVLTLGKNRFTKKGIEVIRFACRKNIVIVGGFSRLVKVAANLFPNEVLESYLDRRLFSGRSLVKNGWTLIRTSAPGYCWLLNGKRLSRSQTQKHRLGRFLGESFNPDLSEADNMFLAGASRLWDCGQHVFRYAPGKNST